MFEFSSKNRVRTVVNIRNNIHASDTVFSVSSRAPWKITSICRGFIASTDDRLSRYDEHSLRSGTRTMWLLTCSILRLSLYNY